MARVLRSEFAVVATLREGIGQKNRELYHNYAKKQLRRLRNNWLRRLITGRQYG